ncbi:monovalent cation:H+ antiporter, CPA1 family [Curtobacterium sp. UNCCL20]|uniref:cation:proton antiporter n=1 Tax=Curtobacterium sp. UNCCL20 TaxID=1502773 RepID=UPI00088AC694|nr:cation:proton antiporter [Curtobacterium sp. UNCCL20]SDQ31209.1 monovalent cation:H+ antiporter, CPA1 family [Curtobacterium sp. UNCCL20]
MSVDETLAWLVAFLVVTVAVSAAARRVGWSAPLALVLIGVAVSYVPGVPRVDVEPDFVLSVLLPPLLFAAALQTSLADVRARREPLLLLSVGLVAFTTVVVGLATWAVVPTLTLAAALAFGAVVAPTDAVAVAAVTRRAPLPRLLASILDGESLLNDATALVALNTAVVAIVATFDPGRAVGEFVLAVVGGAGVGLLVAFVMGAVRRRLPVAVLDTSLSLVTPYVAFLLAHAIGASGPLAVVVAGLFLGFRAPVLQSAEARLAESLNWRTIQFLLENAVFLLIGLSLPAILRGALSSGIGVGRALVVIAVVVVVLVGARLAWSFAVTAVYRWGPARMRRRSWQWRINLPITIAGVRGVVTLAAVFLLPEQTPHRAFLQFLAFVVVLATLLIGLALPWVIRRVALPAPDLDQERMETQLLLAEARAESLQFVDGLDDDAYDDRVVERVRVDSALLGETLVGDDGVRSERAAAYAALRMLAIAEERRAVLRARGEGRFPETAVRAVLTILDIEEAAVRATRSGRTD